MAVHMTVSERSIRDDRNPSLVTGFDQTRQGGSATEASVATSEIVRIVAVGGFR